MHLNRSARNPHLSSEFLIDDLDSNFVHFPLAHLLENLSITLPKDPYYRLWDKVVPIILGSCNGLLFLRGYGHGEGTETYSRMFPPKPFDKKLSIVPVPEHVCVLKGFLCFYHDIKGTDFMIWQMKKFRDKSWIPFLKFSYQNIQMNHEIGSSSLLILRPLHLSENGDTIVLKSNQEDRAILYNRRELAKQRKLELTKRYVG
ncbi:hypothetical protein MTR_7g062070 [Medicago truncatula]|uniref:F-box protein interaction domain protein n=1 Tax=Medicago truncatula TaxID=3880 RepID=A0A072TZJ7_MEDTR|nr:hypothetical protein MTR_7g062070 [Medicago truncatula]